MIPQQPLNLTQIEIVAQPSLTYKLDLNSKRIGRKIDNQEAVMQSVMKILNTERYAYVIYSSQYGVELERLLGKDYDFIVSDLERTIRDSLVADDRILSISNFTAQRQAVDSLLVSFSVNSIYGSTVIQTEVQIV